MDKGARIGSRPYLRWSERGWDSFRRTSTVPSRMYSRCVPWSPCLIRYSPSLNTLSASPGLSTSKR